MGALLAFFPGFDDGGSADAAEGLDVEVLTDAFDDVIDLFGEFPDGGEDDYLGGPPLGVDPLQRPNYEGSGLASSGLCLGNGVFLDDEWFDGSLLDCGGFIETIGVNPSQQVLVQLKIFKSIHCLVPFILDFRRFRL